MGNTGMKIASRTSMMLMLAVSIFPSQAQHRSVWVGSWAASQQVPEPANALPPADLSDATIRQVVHLSCGGSAMRLRISNAFGTTPLHITGVHVARAISSGSSAIDPATDRAVSFDGEPGLVIPPGADYLSDALKGTVSALADISVTMHLAEAPVQQTGHPGSRATSYIAHGDLLAAAEMTSGAKRFDHWTMLSGVDVLAKVPGYSVVALGDSITDGHGATTNGNDRWTDRLAARLQASPGLRGVGVLNQGIGGNHLLTDGLGPNALARFDRDVVSQTAVQVVVVLEGINDLGALSRDNDADPGHHATLVHAMIAAYGQFIERAHAHGLKVIGCTILPFLGSDYYHPGPQSEADRQAVNRWIRTPGHFDSMVDLDRLTEDPQNPGHLAPRFDSGDHLHPSPAGYRAMADAIPLTALVK